MDDIRAVLDSLTELVGDLDNRLTALEAEPPAGEWAQSVAWLLKEFVTTKTVTTTVSILTGFILTIYSMVNGVPLR